MPSALQPDRILTQLADLWASTASSDPSDSTGVLRACALTLIVFVDAEDDPMPLGETLARLMREHPSRAIVIRVSVDDVADHSAESAELRARVFAQCWMPFGRSRQICCEQVEITASVRRLRDVPSMIAPLAAPDVPRVVWFRSTRLSSAPDLSGILTLGDKFIVDSALAGAPAPADLRALAAAGFILGDLEWTRITPLRELLARLLEDRVQPAARIVIEHCGTGAGAAATYLRGWLRSCLPLVMVDLVSQCTEGSGRIRKIRIDDDLNVGAQASCAVFDAGDEHRRANLPERPDYELLSEELRIMKHDPVFEKALAKMTIWSPAS